jgi:hypothetical protein
MSDRPIIFSAPMVRALLDGQKTQTRRLLPTAHPRHPQHNQIRMDVLTYDPQRPEAWYWDGVHDRVGASYPIPYAPGDRLYVREAVCWVSGWGWRYRADNDDLSDKREAGEVSRWRHSIHMPRWASRITLTVTEVRVQRLQEIKFQDVLAEGIEATEIHARRHRQCVEEDIGCGSVCRDSFQELWNSLHGPDAWDANPWVVAVSFTVRKGNIDQETSP